MSPSIYDLGIHKLSERDRVRLIVEISDTLDPATAASLPAALRALIDARMADADPVTRATWDGVKARMRRADPPDAPIVPAV